MYSTDYFNPRNFVVMHLCDTETIICETDTGAHTQFDLFFSAFPQENVLQRIAVLVGDRDPEDFIDHPYFGGSAEYDLV